MNRTIAIGALLLLSATAYADDNDRSVFKHHAQYVAEFCIPNEGQIKYPLTNGLWVDCMTQEFAVDVARAPKWAESLGKALNYARETGKRPGILLIVGSGEQQHVDRLQNTLKSVKPNVEVWTRVEQ